MSNVTAVTDENFESEVINAEGTVLVDFWAEWCGPCKQLGPVIDELATEQSDVKIVKHNIDDGPEIPTKFGVRGIPTLMLFKNGEVVDTKVGAQQKSALEEWLSSQSS